MDERAEEHETTVPATVPTAISDPAPTRNSNRKANSFHQWPTVMRQLRRMIAIGPIGSALAAGDDMIMRTR